jgi:UDP:flavonoid glycosyltransferase YjiC (YdhE family)
MLGVLEESYQQLSQMNPDETVLVATGIFLAGHIVRETLGMRHLTIHLQPSLFRSVYDPPVLGGYRLPDWLPHAAKRAYFNFLDKNVIDRQLAPELNAFRANLGLPPVQHILGDQQHSPQGNLGLFPAWYAPPHPDWPAVALTGFIRYDAAEQTAVPPDVATFLQAGEPPIVFTPGSANLQAHSFFEESVAAAQLLGRRALLVSPYAEQIPDHLPPSVMHVPFAPFSELLPLTAALVYHGGIGTLAQAVAAGIPHLVTPYGHDQPDNARRLQLLGLGDSLSPGRYRARAVADKLNHLLTDTAVQRNCQQYSLKIDFRSALASACQAIERFAAG